MNSFRLGTVTAMLRPNRFTTRAYILCSTSSKRVLSLCSKYSYLSNVTSTKLKEMKNKSESQEHGRETSKVIILVDSLLKFAGEACTRNGCDVCCFLGSRLEELRHLVEKTDLKMKCPDVIVIHASTNNVRYGT
jgi:hypothetical protein